MKNLIMTLFLFVWVIIPALTQQTKIVENEQKSQYENTSYLIVGSLTLKAGFHVNSAQTGDFFARLLDNQTAAAPSEGQNFVRKESVYTYGVTTDDEVLALTSNDKSTSFSYMDGLGRGLQSVIVQGNPSKKDIVQPVYYDSKHRASRSYLPYRSTGSNGAFRANALTEQATFYNSPPSGVTGDSKAYSTTVFEDSPLERVLGVTKVGNDFQNELATGRFTVNTASTVRRWGIVNNLPRSSSFYPAGSLSIQESTDESGTKSRTYTDMAGRTILSQTQSTASAWLNTYYVYNDYSELLFVIPPQSSATLTPSEDHVNLWHFQYQYDEFGRQIGSKAPGTGWTYTIYDKWDRPVLTQDAEQREKSTHEWTYVKYDIHNRPVITGTIPISTAIGTLRTQVANSPALRFETRNTSARGYTLTSSYPTNATDARVLGITYYDDYSFSTNSGWSNNNSSYIFQAITGVTPNSFELDVKGLATGSKTRTQGNSVQWIYSVTYYDQYYQPIQTVSSHQMGTTGLIRSSSKYAFSGEIQQNITTYTHSLGTTNIQRRFTYDHAGRPIKTYHKINNESEVLLSWYQYNELGEPVNVIHHSRNDGGNFLYKTVSKSTIQGWMDEVEYRYSNNDLVFRQKLDYNKPNGISNNTRLDGMITSNQWKHYGSQPVQAYNYTYNIPKRLTASTYWENGGSEWSKNDFYTENNIAYSGNGNITSLRRNKDISGTARQIDNLTYTYSGNRLTAVADAAPTAYKAEGFDDGNPSGTDYAYNENGFLISDVNKGITGITYTLLDRPERVTLSTGANIRYTYSAGGGLMTVSYHSTSNGPADRTLQYVGELVFENGVLTDINHELGRVRADAGNKYQYYLTDHLGSTRVVLQEDPDVFVSSAGFEIESMDKESSQFIGYDDVTKIAAGMLNHTSGEESTYAMRLSGGYGENIGLAKSVSVMAGDTIRMEVYGKYIDLGEAKQNPAVMSVLMAITAADPVSMGVDGGMATAMRARTDGNSGLAGLLTAKKEKGDAPPAYLNYLFFDREMNYKYGGFVQMSNRAREDGSNVAHERLAQEVVAEEPGYYYIYLSNDSNKGSEAFFDDFTIMTSESYIVQQIDYYPYGMIARNNVRTGDKTTNDLFQGKTYEELTSWYDFHARQYDAALGRWFGVDPQDQFSSPYLAMGNNPVMMVDPDGEFAGLVLGAMAAGATQSALFYAASLTAGNSWDWGQFGKSLAIGAISGATTGGIDVLSTSLMKNVYGVIPGALVKGGLSAAGSGISSGLGNVLMDGSWSSFGSGFGKGAMIGGLMGGISGGFSGYQNAKNSVFERNILFGGLTENGRKDAFKHFVLKHELFQSGMMDYSFENIENAFGTTQAIEPGTGNNISIAKAARQFPNGVNSKYSFNSKKLMSLTKIEANVIHEKQHILDLHLGKVNKILYKASSNEEFRAILEIRAHEAVLNAGFQKSYNLSRIKYWSNFIK
ncbi:DUF6443 domain-containing protein [Belliella marina]|uniref:DUF6443 domain-containing protein n=1 Tax=Belliella marina TaxID=1644146 RepID=A0ABW4VIN7_9BACT